MSRLPRIAVGTMQPEADSQVILWALMDALRRAGVQVQSFLSRACFPKYRGAVAITGTAPRYLDSWLMSPQLCRALFLRGAQGADLAVVEGEYEEAGKEDRGGQLEPLCRWLNLPRLVVLDAPQIQKGGIPDRPHRVDGVLVDAVVDSHHLARLATDLEALWGAPVLGGLERLPRLRAQLDAVPRGDAPPRPLCRALGDHFLRYWRPERTWKIACGREFPQTATESLSLEPMNGQLTVAIAYDEAFNCYFPDAFDLLEVHGASMVDFSPLRDESLPTEAELVYLGCGHPERHAATLSENHCMKAALRSHLTRGARIYGEGGGAAYLCQHMETPEGELKRMVGVLPAAARLKPTPIAPSPVQITLSRPNWLGQPGARLRGYRNPNWDIQPLGDLTGCVAEQQHRCDFVGSFQAIGSLLHLHFAGMLNLLRRFFHPEVPEPDFRDPWAAVS